MAADKPRKTSEAWRTGTYTAVVADDITPGTVIASDTKPYNLWDYKFMENLFPPIPGNTSGHSYTTTTDTTTNTSGYTHIFSNPPSFTWAEQDYISGPQFQSLLRRPGETDDEYQVRKDISELACMQGGHRWLKDPASALQTCELCGGIGL